jgi:hypothetical protein
LDAECDEDEYASADVASALRAIDEARREVRGGSHPLTPDHIGEIDAKKGATFGVGSIVESSDGGLSPAIPAFM